MKSTSSFVRSARHTIPRVLSALFVLGACVVGGGCVGEPADTNDLESSSVEDETIGMAAQALLSKAGELRSSVAPNRCLDVKGAVAADGTTVWSYKCNGTNAQRWTYDPSTRQLRSSVGSGNYCLAVRRSDDAALSAVIESCGPGFHQRWFITEGGQVRSDVLNLATMKDDWCLDVAWASTASGTKVQLWHCNKTRAQQWFAVPKLPSVKTTDGSPIRINSVNLEGSGEAGPSNVVLNLAPGQSFTGTFGYTIWQSPSCPGCFDQILVGFGDEAQACLYDGMPPQSGVSGVKNVALHAPDEPGVYYLRFRYAQASTCDLEWWPYNGLPGEARNIGVITVSWPQG